ncbi:hypothetical protein [Streptosporangium subroseum]|nr:hypothetical protein OHB15_29895 [Streptosporangium subroseum]
MSCFVGETGVMTNRGVRPIADPSALPLDMGGLERWTGTCSRV